MEPVGEEVQKDIVDIKKSTVGRFLIALAVVVIIVYFLVGALQTQGPEPVKTTPVEGSTFLDTGDEMLRDSEGKPYVILFSTTTCPHCQWIKSTFDSLAAEDFASEINLQHWELDTGDNTLTGAITETRVPAWALNLYEKYNPGNSVPTFVFGGKYIRIGNSGKNNLDAEKQDFEFIIKKLLE
jgi:thiol-disulfide isomerase/thioredoxin